MHKILMQKPFKYEICAVVSTCSHILVAAAYFAHNQVTITATCLPYKHDLCHKL